MSKWDEERGDAPWKSAAAELGAADASMRASASVEERLLAEVRGIAAARRRRQWMAAASIAAMLALAAAVWLARPTAPRDTMPRDTTPEASAAVNVESRDVTTEFVPLAYSDVPSVNRHVIRLRVSRVALTSFGLASTDIPSASSSDRVLVDVVVGEDGLARAVRFVEF